MKWISLQAKWIISTPGNVKPSILIWMTAAANQTFKILASATRRAMTNKSQIAMTNKSQITSQATISKHEVASNLNSQMLTPKHHLRTMVQVRPSICTRITTPKNCPETSPSTSMSKNQCRWSIKRRKSGNLSFTTAMDSKKIRIRNAYLNPQNWCQETWRVMLIYNL